MANNLEISDEELLAAFQPQHADTVVDSSQAGIIEQPEPVDLGGDISDEDLIAAFATPPPQAGPALPEMSKVPEAWSDDIVDFVSKTYQVWKHTPTDLIRKGFSLLNGRQAVGEYDDSGKFIGSRLETAQEAGERRLEERKFALQKAGADEAGTAVDIAAGVVGTVLDPTAAIIGGVAAIPKAINLGTRLARLSAAGATYELPNAALEQVIETGEVEHPEIVAARTALAAVIPPVLDRGLSMAGKLLTKLGKDSASKVVDQLDSKVAAARDQGLNPEAAIFKAVKEVSDDPTNALKPLNVNALSKQVAWKDGAEEGMKEIQAKINKASTVASRLEESTGSTMTSAHVVGSSLWNKAGKALDSTKEVVDNLLRPISSSVREIAPTVYTRMRQMDRWTMEREASYVGSVAKFSEGVERAVKGADAAILNKALLNREWDKAAAVLSKPTYSAVKVMDHTTGKKIQINLAAELPGIKASLAKVHTDLNANGISVTKLPDYFPRKVVDYPGLAKEMSGKFGAQWEAVLKKEVTKKGSQLTPSETSELVGKFLRRTAQTGISGNRVGRERAIETVMDQHVPYYEPSHKALVTYMRNAARSIEESKFFGKTGTPDPEIAPNFKDSVSRIVNAEWQRGTINAAQVDKLKELLESRMMGGRNAPAHVTQKATNFFYGALLANPVSAVSNLADIGITAYTQGMGRTAKAIVEKLSGKAGLKLEDIGFNAIAEEMSTTMGHAKLLDKLLGVSQFKRVDRLSKTIFINSAWSRVKDLAAKGTGKEFAQLEHRWKAAMGDDWQATLVDLRAGKLTENTKTLLWHELADVQPISKSEMPAQWLEAKNGRIFYALHTFQLKQLDLVRNRIYELAKTNPKEATRQLVKYGLAVTAVGLPVNKIQDLMLNRESGTLGEETTSVLLKQLAISKYWLDTHAKDKKAGTAMFELIKPPVGVADDIIGDLGNFGQQFNSLKDVPLAGKMLYNWFGGGVEKELKRQGKAKAEKEQKMFGSDRKLKDLIK